MGRVERAFGRVFGWYPELTEKDLSPWRLVFMLVIGFWTRGPWLTSEEERRLREAGW